MPESAVIQKLVGLTLAHYTDWPSPGFCEREDHCCQAQFSFAVAPGGGEAAFSLAIAAASGA